MRSSHVLSGARRVRLSYQHLITRDIPARKNVAICEIISLSFMRVLGFSEWFAFTVYV